MSIGDWKSDADPLGGVVDVGSREDFAVEAQRPAAAVVLLKVEGRLDLWTSLPLLDAILAAFREHPGLIVVDMSDVLSMDHTGLHALVEGSLHVQEEQVGLAVVCPAGSAVARFLEQSDGHRTLTVHRSLDDVLRPWLDGAGELPAGI